jgi:flagellar hook-length control protein FliK
MVNILSGFYKQESVQSSVQFGNAADNFSSERSSFSDYFNKAAELDSTSNRADASIQKDDYLKESSYRAADQSSSSDRRDEVQRADSQVSGKKSDAGEKSRDCDKSAADSKKEVSASDKSKTDKSGSSDNKEKSAKADASDKDVAEKDSSAKKLSLEESAETENKQAKAPSAEDLQKSGVAADISASDKNISNNKLNNNSKDSKVTDASHSKALSGSVSADSASAKGSAAVKAGAGQTGGEEQGGSAFMNQGKDSSPFKQVLQSRDGKMTIVDNRGGSLAAKSKAVSKSAAEASSKGVSGVSSSSAAKNIEQLVLDMGAAVDSDSSSATDTQMTKKSFMSKFESFMKAQGNQEIVNKAKVILSNNNAGEIRLHLRPDNMGSVKVLLKLNDNTITGKIIVENSAVRQAFESNMDSFQKAFEEKGFSFAGMDVSSGNDGKAGEQEHPDNAFFNKKNRGNLVLNNKSVEAEEGFDRLSKYTNDNRRIDMVV